MPRYHFAVLNKSGRHDDHVETELANDAAAREHVSPVVAR